jgi:hypothetical protein
MTEKSYILEISFARVHFLKPKIEKKFLSGGDRKKIEGTVLM